MTVEDVVTGMTTRIEAEVMIYAIGGFLSPWFPEDLGIDNFGGLMWHSARWRHDIDLKGKRVGVIGNGCSAYPFHLLHRNLDQHSQLVRNLSRGSPPIPLSPS